VSDQDFFFDEDEAPAAKPAKPAKADKTAAPAAKAGAKRPTASKAAQSAPADAYETVPLAEQTVTVVVAGLLMVISLLVGAIIGFLLGGTSTPAISSVPEAAAPAGGTVTDPGPLTNEQMQGGMPAGHPAVGATGAAGATAP
jgi:hypothetical protein